MFLHFRRCAHVYAFIFKNLHFTSQKHLIHQNWKAKSGLHKIRTWSSGERSFRSNQRTVTHEDHWGCQTLNVLSKYNGPRYHYCLSYIYAELLLISPIRELYRNRYYLAKKLTFNNNNCVIVFKKQTAAGQTNNTAHIWLAQKLIWGPSLPKHTHLGLTWDRCVFALPEQNHSTIHPHVPAVGTHGYICWHTVQWTITEKMKS